MRIRFIGTVLAAVAFGLPWCLSESATRGDGVRIIALEPTPLFPKAKPGEPLRQVARLKLENRGPAVEAHVKITVAGQRGISMGLRAGRRIERGRCSEIERRETLWGG